MPPELHWLPTPRHDPVDPACPPATAIQRLGRLRPDRPLTLHEAAAIAERQAQRLLHLRGASRAPIPAEVVTGLYQIEVRLEPRLPIAGYVHWARDTFLIHVNANDHSYEQRLTIAHELKHIVDHALDRNAADLANPPGTDRSAHDIEESVAEYFARCLLMPKNLVLQHHAQGAQRADQISRIFAVPRYAARQRLLELGLVHPVDSPRLWAWLPRKML